MPIIHCLHDELVDPDTLIDHPKNRNKHSKDQMQRLGKIIAYQGWRYAIKVSKQSGYITTGHGRKYAALLKKWDKVPVVYQDYENSDQEYADVQADNAVASWAELDLAGINLDVPDLGPDFDIDLLGIKDFVIEPADKYGAEDDDVPEVKTITEIQMGHLFSLGSHRLLCGDATDPDHIALLMNGEKADMVYTDPPYGMNLDTDFSGIHHTRPGRSSVHTKLNSGRKYRAVIGDSDKFDPRVLIEYFSQVDEIFLWGADYYRKLIPDGGSWIVWDKRQTASGDTKFDSVIGSCFELAWSKQKHKRDIARILHCGLYSIENDKRQHPTQKPVALHEWFFERWGKDKTNIVDLYGGSGSTLIACEKQNKKCFMSEIDPQYCQVIIDRWEKFTGQKAVKVDEKGIEQVLINGVGKREVRESVRKAEAAGRRQRIKEVESVGA